jgi:hypothetical protein
MPPHGSRFRRKKPGNLQAERHSKHRSGGQQAATWGGRRDRVRRLGLQAREAAVGTAHG